MSKEYTYFETMEEILKDKNKRFIDEKSHIMFFHKESNIICIQLNPIHIMKTLVINDNWFNTKWILVEDDKMYNVRIYKINSSNLISSENIVMTEGAIEEYCNKIVESRKECSFMKRERGRAIPSCVAVNTIRVEYEEIII